MRGVFVGALICAFHPTDTLASWYYCDPLHAYYPQVQSCPVPFRAVPPTQQRPSVPQKKEPTLVERLRAEVEDQAKLEEKGADEELRAAQKKINDAPQRAAELQARGMILEASDLLKNAGGEYTLAQTQYEVKIRDIYDRAARRLEEVEACMQGETRYCPVSATQTPRADYTETTTDKEAKGHWCYNSWRQERIAENSPYNSSMVYAETLDMLKKTEDTYKSKKEEIDFYIKIDANTADHLQNIANLPYEEMRARFDALSTNAVDERLRALAAKDNTDIVRENQCQRAIDVLYARDDMAFLQSIKEKSLLAR